MEEPRERESHGDPERELDGWRAGKPEMNANGCLASWLWEHLGNAYQSWIHHPAEDDSTAAPEEAYVWTMEIRSLEFSLN